MKHSPAGKLAMGREQLTACSHSLFMQKVHHRELLPRSILSPSQATNQAREGRTLPLSPRGHLGARCHLGSAHYLPSCRRPHSHMVNAAAPHLLLMWMMPSCILLSNYPTGPVASPRCIAAAAHGSYHFGDLRFTMLCRSSLLIFRDLQLTSDHTG